MACALVGEPELLFLDEPPTGLDPQARRNLWNLVSQLRAEGRTIILTTHYMDEAERLCDRVAVMDYGRIIALGAPSELIASIGGEQILGFAICASAPLNPPMLPGKQQVKSQSFVFVSFSVSLKRSSGSSPFRYCFRSV